jgi:hypothetical protein
MSGITRYKLVLIILLITSVTVLGVQIIAFKEQIAQQAYITSWGYLPLTIPALIFTISFLPLMYSSWFKESRKGFVCYIKLLFFTKGLISPFIQNDESFSITMTFPIFTTIQYTNNANGNTANFAKKIES